MKHRCPANWKMLPENDLDGYHLGFVHLALWKTVRTQYHRVIGEERSIKAVVRDWGHGHLEIDWSPGYQEPFEWFGGGPDALVAPLRWRPSSAATARRGPGGASIEGPPHALIFPNLFLGETNVAIVEPVGVEECVHWHTPMFLEGRAGVQPAAPAPERGGHGAGVVSPPRRRDHRQPQPGRLFTRTARSGSPSGVA